ncbi:MAG TPA: hypothetical protein PK156_44385 [Polyangium sp.]|nr:hypothetical protein [Polyangium sp.]
MRNVSTILLACSVVSLGGCIILFGPDDHDDEPSPGESSSSSGAGGSSGDGGPSCTTICGRENHCSVSSCLTGIWGTRVAASANQRVNGVAVASDKTVGIVGAYYGSTGFTIGGNDLQTAAPAEGFGAFLNGDTGAIEWAADMSSLTGEQPREGHSIAIFDDVFWLAGTFSPTFMDQDLGLVSYNRSNKAVLNTVTIGRENPDDIVAIVGDDADVYTIGTLSMGTMSESFSCMNGTLLNDNGMFVMRFDKVGMCQWAQSFTGGAQPIRPTAIAATDSGVNGVWFTGTFYGSISTGNSTMEVNAQSMSEEGFLMGRAADGMPLLSATLGPGVVPLAITADTKGIIYVAGQLYGSTAFKDDLQTGETAAFVAAFETNNIKNAKWVTVYPGSSLIGGGAKATAVSVDDGNVYVAGVFSRSIEIPVGGGSETLDMPDANPFVARLDRTDGHTLAFHGFSGGGEVLNEAFPIHMSVAATGVIIAGTWTNNLDFSPPGGEPILLDASSGTDAFVVWLDKH